jgi:hypothetical protein
MEERLYQISLIYRVTIDENRLTKHRESWPPEDIEQLKQVLRATLNNQQATDFLALHEVGYDFGRGGEEGVVEAFTGLDIDDHTPIDTALQALPEDQQYFSDGSDATLTLSDAFKAELDHIHVHRIVQQPAAQPESQPAAAQSQNQPAKQRHHKRKPHRKK